MACKEKARVIRKASKGMGQELSICDKELQIAYCIYAGMQKTRVYGEGEEEKLRKRCEWKG